MPVLLCRCVARQNRRRDNRHVLALLASALIVSSKSPVARNTMEDEFSGAGIGLVSIDH